MRRAVLIAITAVLAISGFVYSQKSHLQTVGPTEDGAFLLNTDWRIKPAGTTIRLSTHQRHYSAAVGAQPLPGRVLMPILRANQAGQADLPANRPKAGVDFIATDQYEDLAAVVTINSGVRRF
jgi:hypothetical protein